MNDIKSLAWVLLFLSAAVFLDALAFVLNVQFFTCLAGVSMLAALLYAFRYVVMNLNKKGE